MKIGEVYFIREQDKSSGKPTPNVKIGIVAAQGGSSGRMDAHQTGNPRQLLLHHVTVTPSPYWIENGLHRRLNSKLVKNEWFALEDRDLEEAIALAEQLAESAFRHVPKIEEFERLEKCPSDGRVLMPSDESSQWLLDLSRAHAKIKVCDDLEKRYRDSFYALDEDEKAIVQDEEIIILEHYIETKFDKDSFTAMHPDLAKAFTTTDSKWSFLFLPKYIDLEVAEIDPELASFERQFRDMCDQVAAKVQSFGDLKGIYSKLERIKNVFDWEKEIAKANLGVLCGTAESISKQCSWKRANKDRPLFDNEGLESAHPSEYNEFSKSTMKTKMKTKRRPLRKQAQPGL
jgi:hypothetical protein